MKTSTPSSSALAQNGWNFGSANSLPATLPPIATPRSPSFFIAVFELLGGEIRKLQRDRRERRRSDRGAAAQTRPAFVLDADDLRDAVAVGVVPDRD